MVALPITASAAPFTVLTTWTVPAPSSFYSYGDPITVQGTWQLPANWAGNIYVVQDGLEIASTTINNIGGSSTSTGSFNIPIGPQPSGSHNIQLKFWGGEECAVNANLNVMFGTSFAPTCPVTTANFAPSLVYPMRTYSVGNPPFPRLVISPSSDPALNFANVPSGGSQVMSFSLTNTGGQSLSGSISGLAAPFYCISGCNYVVAPGGPAQQVQIQFVPTTVSSFSQFPNFSCSGSPLACDVASFTRHIIGNSVGSPMPPELWVSQSVLNYGTVNAGSSRNLTISVSNHGGGLLNGSVTFSSPNFACIPSCNYSLFAAATTTITIRFSPPNGSSGSVSESANFSGGAGVVVSLQAQVNDLPILNVSPLSWSIGTPVNVGSSVTGSFTVRNMGAGLLSGTVQGLPLNGFSCVSNCTYTNLPPGIPWSVGIRFAPLTAGPASATAEFTNTLGVSVFVPLSGNGNASPTASFTPSLNFGNTIVGQTAYATTTLTNSGVGILSGTVSLASSLFACVSGCTYNLPAGSSTAIVFSFTPVANGVVTAVATISGRNLNMQGNGIPPANFGEYAYFYDTSCAGWCDFDVTTYYPTALSPYDYGTTTFGTPVQNADMYLHLSNLGGGPVTYSVQNSPHFVCISTGFGPCSGTLAANPSQPTNRWFSWRMPIIQFQPGAEGDYNEQVIVNFDQGNGPQQRIYYASGRSYAAPLLSVSPLSFTWPGSTNVGSPTTTTLTITNIGTSTLDGTLTTPDPWPWWTGGSAFTCLSGCSFTGILNGQNHYAVVQFAPTTTMWYQGVAQLNSNGGNNRVNLQGLGNLAPTILLTPSTAQDMGSANLGAYTEQAIQVTNVGLGVLTGSATLVSGTHFQCMSQCTYNLPAGSSTWVTFRFAPLAVGILTDTVRFISNASNGTQLLTIFGDATFAPIIDIRGDDTDFGSVVVGKYQEHIFRVKNVGTVNLGSGTFNITGPFVCVNPVDITDGLCHYTLNAGQEVQITVRFTPTAVGPAIGLVQLSGIPLGQFFVTGRGVPPGLKFKEK